MGKAKKDRKNKWYKIFNSIAFIILNFIIPLRDNKYSLRLLVEQIKLIFTPSRVREIENNKYLTKKDGWNEIRDYLDQKGYKVEILFNECIYTTEEGKKYVLQGKNIGKYYKIWQLN